MIQAYREWLAQTDIPKLLFYASPGALIDADEIAWCRENLSNLETLDLGEAIHFVQEDHPDLIGSKLATWHATL